MTEPTRHHDPELRAFLAVVYRALLMVVRYLQKTYDF